MKLFKRNRNIEGYLSFTVSINKKYLKPLLSIITKTTNTLKLKKKLISYVFTFLIGASVGEVLIGLATYNDVKFRMEMEKLPKIERKIIIDWVKAGSTKKGVSEDIKKLEIASKTLDLLKDMLSKRVGFYDDGYDSKLIKREQQKMLDLIITTKGLIADIKSPSFDKESFLNDILNIEKEYGEYVKHLQYKMSEYPEGDFNYIRQ